LKLIKYLNINSDTFGILACALCIIHCIATPFVFMAYSYSNIQQIANPIWWKNLDFIFLIISFVMIYFSTQTTSKGFMKYFFWLSWLLLSMMIINEKIGLLSVPEYMTYGSAALLTTIHLYNLKYCQC
jgi:Na+-transporting NADH:ubiquinone oxidoreductase subunit NqrB